MNQTWLKKVKNKYRQVNKKLEAKPLTTTAAVLLVCAAIIILRKPEAFTHAQFWAEDGIQWFQQAYNRGFWATILSPYSGSAHLVLRLTGYLATLFPLSVAPLVFNCTALAVQLLPVFIINSSRVKYIVQSRLVAIAVSLIYVCITNSSEVFVNLTNVQWHLGITGFLILMAGKNKDKRWLVFDIIALTTIGLTGPLTFFLAGIAFLVWFQNRDRNTLIRLGVLMATSAYQLLVLLVIDPGRRGGHMDMAWTNLMKMLSGQIFTGGILGAKNADVFYSSPLLYVALGLAITLIVYAVVKGPAWLRYANLYAFVIFVAALASLKPLKGVDVWGILTHEATGQRYWFIPIFCWLVTLFWLMLCASNRVIKVISSILVALFVVVGIQSSWRIDPLPDLDYQEYVSEFNSVDSGTHYDIPINPAPWKIELIKH